MAVIEVYKGHTIRKYGTRPGESVYPICFTDNLHISDEKPVLHGSWEEARKYIDKHSKN